MESPVSCDNNEDLEKKEEIDVGDDTGADLDLSRTKSSVWLSETLTLPREILFVGVICVAQLTAQIGLGQTLSILHIIGDSFHITNPGDLTWLIAGYSLTVGTFILFSGRLGDLFGYKRMLLIGYLWFALWSLVAGCAVYSNHVLFVFARVLQGIGPAITLPNGIAVLGATYPPGMRKNLAFSFFGACAPSGGILGSVFAGIFALAWWPWTFWSFAIALVITAVVGSFVVPDIPQKHIEGMTLREKLRDLDIPGALVGIMSLVLINFAWNQAPIVGWDKAYVYVLLIIGILLVPVFFYIEVKIAPAPLIPLEALNGDVGFVLGCIACGWATFGIWIFYTWQLLLVLREKPPLLASAMLCPVAITGLCAALSTGYMLTKVGPAGTMTAALTFFTVGIILLATTPVGQIYWAQTFVGTILTPFGMDMSFPAACVILSNAVPRRHQGIAASLVNTVVNYSISLGLGFAGTVQSQVDNGGQTTADVLKGYRSAEYMGIGLAGLGLCLSILFVARGCWKSRRAKAKDGTNTGV
ncbi:MFS general substrate transporter [Rhizodiscina lignyota]|uniref:MFS general substrate transporter n=1 Tax=Rhizodiscina lignyota TaxID=1504668 RepID=A0A9P4IT65_9PEZI|nr:MFS general substrate transporter [Rhizodiscina lignyota]